MWNGFYPSDEYETNDRDTAEGHSDPYDVVFDPSLTIEQKRAILASWASDARAVRDRPALRQLEDGTVLHIDKILGALKELDGKPAPSIKAGVVQPRERLGRRRTPVRTLRRLGISRRHDDDDDPPPCPSAAKAPRPAPILSGEAALSAA